MNWAIWAGRADCVLRWLATVLATFAAVLGFAMLSIGQVHAGEDERGRDLYYGRHEAYARVAGIPAAAAACAACHRPSGLGSFEGGVAAPPIAGPFLFQKFDPTEPSQFPWRTTYRVRPAYDMQALKKTLNEGIAPDGRQIGALMPRYAFNDTEVSALMRYLESLSATVAPGVTDEVVRFAAITTPDATAAEKDTLLKVLTIFFEDKNAGTRHEARRRVQNVRGNELMYRYYRKWELVHWALEGPPSEWDAQLRQHMRQTPVFAVLSGIGHDTWKPVHAFCERERMPCLFPNAALPPRQQDFYSVYFSAGLWLELEALAKSLAELGDKAPRLVPWTSGTSAGRAQAAAIREVLPGASVYPSGTVSSAGDAVVTTLPWNELSKRYVASPIKPAQVFVFSSMMPDLPPYKGRAALDAELDQKIVVVSSLLEGERLRRQVTRARLWLAGKKIPADAERIAINALFAATVGLESLLHVDQNFSREYCLERLEHGLENMPPITAYPRLSIGPDQRFALKFANSVKISMREAADAAQRTASPLTIGAIKAGP